MPLHDILLHAARIGVSWTNRAAQTHQVLGLGINLKPDPALTRRHICDGLEGPERPEKPEEHKKFGDEQLEIHEDIVEKQGGEADGAAGQTSERECGRVGSKEYDLPESETSYQNGDVTAPEIGSALLPSAEEVQVDQKPTETLVCHDGEDSDAGSQSILVPPRVTLSNSPSFASWESCYAPDNHSIRLTNVHFKNCEQSDFTLKLDCELVNVTFNHCTFNHTAFANVDFYDVTFSHVNFTDTTLYWFWLKNVTLSQLQLEHDLWRHTWVENALIGKDSFVLRPGSEREYGVLVESVTSKAVQGRYAAGALLKPPKNKLCGYDRWERDVYLFPPTPSGDILSRLAEHKDIIDRIMRYCFPASSIHIYEYPRWSRIPATTMKASYSAHNVDPRFGSVTEHMTMYFGSLQPETPLKAHALGKRPQRGTGDCTNLLLVNKRFHVLASKHMYGRTFHLQCSAEGARQFLIAHVKEMQRSRQLVLYYHWLPDELHLCTDINAWRYLLGVVRHRFSSIPNVRLHVGKHFWTRYNMSWRGGAARARYMVSDGCVDSNPLVEAYKFAAPDDRWEVKGDESTHRTDGVVLQIDIEGTDTLEKDDFVRDLTDAIEERRIGRPLFVRSPKGREVKYKCAGDFWEDQRTHYG